MPRTIKALSLWQPWASLWAGGKKTIETRSWRLGGPLPVTIAVHAAKKFDHDSMELCRIPPFSNALIELGYDRIGDLPFGCMLGLVRIARVYQFSPRIPLPEYPEHQFGNYEYGRWGFVAEKARLFAEPIPAKGAQGIFNWEAPDELKFADGVTEAALKFGIKAQREQAAAALPPLFAPSPSPEGTR